MFSSDFPLQAHTDRSIRQTQEKEPILFVQTALTSHVFNVGSAHSLMSVQETPSPRKPALQAHEKRPSVYVQMAFEPQLCDPS